MPEVAYVVGVDESEHSYYALQWALQHFFPPGQPHQYRLVVVTAKPTAASALKRRVNRLFARSFRPAPML